MCDSQGFWEREKGKGLKEEPWIQDAELQFLSKHIYYTYFCNVSLASKRQSTLLEVFLLSREVDNFTTWP
jgi:polyferredoxin